MPAFRGVRRLRKKFGLRSWRFCGFVLKSLCNRVRCRGNSPELALEV